MRINHLGKSIQQAWCGLAYVYKHEQNFRIQVFMGIVVALFAVILDVRKAEYIVLGMLILAVLSLELINSAIEKFFDVAHPRLRFHIGIAKDIMAGLVLMISLGAMIIGGIIFWPYLVPIVLKVFSY